MQNDDLSIGDYVYIEDQGIYGKIIGFSSDRDVRAMNRKLTPSKHTLQIQYRDSLGNLTTAWVLRGEGIKVLPQLEGRVLSELDEEPE